MTMPIEERMVALAVDALAEQERGLAEMRSRPPALLAAGAVAASLLAHTVFHDPGPDGLALLCVILGAFGAAALLGFCLALLWPRELAFSLNATNTYRWLFGDGLTDGPGSDLALADALTELRAANKAIIDTLAIYLQVAVIALAIEVAGLAAAAAIVS